MGETQLFAKWSMRRVKQEWKTAERTQHTDAFHFLKTFILMLHISPKPLAQGDRT